MGNLGANTSLSKKLSSFMKKEGDVTFLVGEEKKEFKVLSQILSALSPVFKTMFSSPWKEKSKVIKVPDVPPKIFGIFLKLMIDDDMTIETFMDLELPMNEIVWLLYVSKKYDVGSILTCCKKAIKKNISIQNAAAIFDQLQFLDEPNLLEHIFNFIKRNADELFKTTEFLEASRELLTKILKSSQLKVEEITTFKAIVTWAENGLTKENKVRDGANIREYLGDLLSLIRFPIMTHRDLVLHVGPTSVLTDKELLQLHEYIALVGHPNRSSKLKDLPYSAMLRYGCKPIYVLLSPPPKRQKVQETDSDSDDATIELFD